MKRFAIIMAGGRGERLWPISTKSMPKQFLSLNGKNNFINETISRIERVVPLENIIVVTNKEYKAIAERYIDRRIKEEQILYEPEQKNTAACIAYALMKIKAKEKDAIISVFPADHVIEDEIQFAKDIELAIEKVDDSVMTIGVNPGYPSTQYGYIKFAEKDEKLNVLSFKEKPTIEKATEYIQAGDYLWNSGILVSKLSTLENEYEKHLPELYKEFTKVKCEEIDKHLDSIYKNICNISIDYGILEKTEKVSTIKATFDWKDVGDLKTFLELQKDNEKNILKINSTNCRVYATSKKDIILEGIDDLLVVENEQYCFITKNSNIMEVKDIKEKYIKYKMNTNKNN